MNLHHISIILILNCVIKTSMLRQFHGHNYPSKNIPVGTTKQPQRGIHANARHHFNLISLEKPCLLKKPCPLMKCAAGYQATFDLLNCQCPICQCAPCLTLGRECPNNYRFVPDKTACNCPICECIPKKCNIPRCPVGYKLWNNPQGCECPTCVPPRQKEPRM